MKPVLENLEKHFHGEMCKKCKGTLRYKKGHSCVTCTRQKSNEQARKRYEEKQKQIKLRAEQHKQVIETMIQLSAESVSDKHFHGNSCKKCQGTLRYKIGGACVNCLAKYREKRRSPD